MTEATQGSTASMTDDQKLSEAEIEAVQRDRFLADPAVPADQYPRLWNISAGMVYERVIRALEPSPPEYVTVPLPPWAGETSNCPWPSRTGTYCGKPRSSGGGSFQRNSSRIHCATSQIAAM
jgi:hypothetical protein